MANMSYCRFQNTCQDLTDCLGALRDGDHLSDDEFRAYKRLVELCREIVEDYPNQRNDTGRCEECGELTTNFINGIPVCKECEQLTKED